MNPSFVPWPFSAPVLIPAAAGRQKVYVAHARGRRGGHGSGFIAGRRVRALQAASGGTRGDAGTTGSGSSPCLLPHDQHSAARPKYHASLPLRVAEVRHFGTG